jgi:hypothetical protein
MNMNESGFMSLGKSDFIKSVSVAVITAAVTALAPTIAPIMAALNAGTIPTLPPLSDVSVVLLKSLGVGITTASGYIVHKFFSDNGSPLGGALGKYFVDNVDPVKSIDATVASPDGKIPYKANWMPGAAIEETPATFGQPEKKA